VQLQCVSSLRHLWDSVRSFVVCLFDLRVGICASTGQEVQYLEVPHVLGSFDHEIIIMIRTQDTMSGNVGESQSVDIVVSLITALTRRSDLELAGTYTKSARVCNGQPVYRYRYTAVHCSGGRCTEDAYLYQPRVTPADRGGAEQRLWVVSIGSQYVSCSSSGASIWLEAPDQAPPPLRPDDPAVAGTWQERGTANPDLRIWAKWGSSCDSPQTDGGCGTHGRCVASGDRPHQQRCGCDNGWGGMRCEHDPCAAVNCTRLVSAGALGGPAHCVPSGAAAVASFLSTGICLCTVCSCQ
jgi:hypothetical protein